MVMLCSNIVKSKLVLTCMKTISENYNVELIKSIVNVNIMTLIKNVPMLGIVI